MSCPRRRQCGGGNSWSYSWSTCNGVTTYQTSGNVPAQYLQNAQQQPAATKPESAVTKPQGSTGGSKDSADYHDYGLYLHNWFRKRHGSGKMTLVERLNNAADAYAYKLACRGQMVHTSGLDYNENLYMSSDTGASKKEHVRQACQMWYDENKLYSYSRPGFSMQTGHFTAMVWKGSTQLGIGYGCANGWVVVVACYKPCANMQGDFPNNVFHWREVEDSEDEEEVAKKKEAEKKKKEEKAEEMKKPEEEDDEDELPEEAKSDFESRADKDKTIGWEELMAMMNENVKVAFKFDGFDKTICRLLISMITLRTAEKPRINLEEFGQVLKSVEGFLDAYAEFDVDNSGNLDPFELKSALEEAGFKVSFKTFKILQDQFGDESGNMDFRGFVLCFVLLGKLQISSQVKSNSGMFEDFSMRDWMQEEININSK